MSGGEGAESPHHFSWDLACGYPAAGCSESRSTPPPWSRRAGGRDCAAADDGEEEEGEEEEAEESVA